jgi:hypothetical protein
MQNAECKMQKGWTAKADLILHSAICILHSIKKPLPEIASGSGIAGFDFWPEPKSDSQTP